MREVGEDAMLKVDLLIQSALRQLPANIRDMPVEDAFKLCVQTEGGLCQAQGSGDVSSTFPSLAAGRVDPYSEFASEEDVRRSVEAMRHLSQQMQGFQGELETMSR